MNNECTAKITTTMSAATTRVLTVFSSSCYPYTLENVYVCLYVWTGVCVCVWLCKY